MVPLNYNFISARVYTCGTMWFHVCKMPKSLVEIIIYTRQKRVIYTTCVITRHVIIYTRRGYCFYINRFSAEISYWMYGYTGNCITQSMTILCSQFTLYITSIATRMIRSQLLHTFRQSQFVNQVVMHCYNNTDNFFKNCIFYTII